MASPRGFAGTQTLTSDTKYRDVSIMMKLYVVLLGFSALVISGVGATFSVTGLAKLFSGAPVAVMFMAGALEFAKLVCASFLHRTWSQMHRLLKVYLTAAICILVMITSMGIFGYLTHAYQSTSEKLKAAEVRIESFQKDEKKITGEIERLEEEIRAIPPERISKRLELQKELAPQFETLKRQAMDVNIRMRELNIQKLSFQTEIGPLLYVARAMGRDTDTVAHWLIFIFVAVFDPLAVCLVVSTSFAIHLAGLESREKKERLQREKHEAAVRAAQQQAEIKLAAEGKLTPLVPLAPVAEPASVIPPAPVAAESIESTPTKTAV